MQLPEGGIDFGLNRASNLRRSAMGAGDIPRPNRPSRNKQNALSISASTWAQSDSMWTTSSLGAKGLNQPKLNTRAKPGDDLPHLRRDLIDLPEKRSLQIATNGSKRTPDKTTDQVRSEPKTITCLMQSEPYEIQSAPARRSFEMREQSDSVSSNQAGLQFRISA